MHRAACRGYTPQRCTAWGATFTECQRPDTSGARSAATAVNHPHAPARTRSVPRPAEAPTCPHDASIPLKWVPEKTRFVRHRAGTNREKNLYPPLRALPDNSTRFRGGAQLESIHVERLDHLGLLASVIKEVGLIGMIDARLVPDKQEEITAGEAVAGRLLNGLGFANRLMSLTPPVFRQHTPGLVVS
jgi:hypothetical protein